MTSRRRSKQILELATKKQFPSEKHNKNELKQIIIKNLSDAEEMSSPLKPEALTIRENLQDVWDEVFSDCKEDPLLISVQVEPVENCEKTTNIVSCQPIKNDVYLTSEAMSPAIIIDVPTSSLNNSFNINSPAPLTPIFDKLLSHAEEPKPQSPEEIHTSTPIPSPGHDFDDTSEQAIDSDHPSPAANVQTLYRNRGKKRTLNKEDWKDVKRKKLLNLGKTHNTRKGRKIEKKKMKPPCSCKDKCATKFTHSERLDMFNKFWNLGDREKQWLFVANHTDKMKKKRTLTRDLKKKRQYSYKYYLPKDIQVGLPSKNIVVCKTMFIHTLGITERLTRTAWQKYDGSTAVQEDLRGRHKHHKKIMDEEMVKSVCSHVNAFSPIESHYVRKSSKRLYLDSSLSIARMFKLYKEWPDLNNYSQKALTLRHYRDIVNTHFNLSFHVPKKDQCDQCHVYHNTENPSEEVKSLFLKHQYDKNFARQLKAQDKQEAFDSNGSIVCVTFDFQKVLTCPHGNMSILYYKRKLSCYHFTVYDVCKKQGYCYVWDESIAKLGANEVASCLYDFIVMCATNGVKDIRFWSDNCTGQNRNRIVFVMYAYAAKELNITITHRFLEKGHTQNEGDSVHSVIERAAEHKLIYTPEEWKLHINWAKISENPYKVIDVYQEMIYDFKDLLKNKNWIKNTNNDKLLWTKIKEVSVEKNQTNKLFYKYNLEKDTHCLVLRQNTRNTAEIALKNAYSGPIPIPKDKYKDLLQLCETKIIPTKYHNFFKSLAHTEVPVNEPNDSNSSD